MSFSSCRASLSVARDHIFEIQIHLLWKYLLSQKKESTSITVGLGCSVLKFILPRRLSFVSHLRLFYPPDKETQ